MDLHAIWTMDKKFEELTGLPLGVCLALRDKFDDKYLAHEESKKLKFRPGKSAKLDSHTLLFMTLFYLRHYPKLSVMEFYFGLDKSNISRWVRRIISWLAEILQSMGYAPLGDESSVEAIQKAFENLKFLCFDGASRPIQRPDDDKVQRMTYSGKNKDNEVKTVLGVDQDKSIVYLSNVCNGAAHDFAVFQNTEIGNKIPTGVKVYVDTGFQGIRDAYPHLKVAMPKKSRLGVSSISVKSMATAEYRKPELRSNMALQDISDMKRQAPEVDRRRCACEL